MEEEESKQQLEEGDTLRNEEVSVGLTLADRLKDKSWQQKQWKKEPRPVTQQEWGKKKEAIYKKRRVPSLVTLTRKYIIEHSQLVHQSSRRVFLPTTSESEEKGKEKEKGKEEWADLNEASFLDVTSNAEKNVRLLALLIGISDKDILNVYQHGSRVWGTAHPLSDWDFVVVVKDKDSGWGWGIRQPVTAVGYKELKDFINVLIVAQYQFTARLESQCSMAVPCMFLDRKYIWREKVQFTYTYNQELFVQEILFHVLRMQKKAKIYIKKSLYKTKKLYVHCLRYLHFGIQLANTGMLTDMSGGMEYWREVESIYFEKDLEEYLNTKYKEHESSLLIRFNEIVNNDHLTRFIKDKKSVMEYELMNSLNQFEFYPEEADCFFCFPEFHNKVENSLLALCIEKIVDYIIEGNEEMLGPYAVLPVEIAEKVIEIVARYDPDMVGGRLLRWIRLEKPSENSSSHWRMVDDKKNRRNRGIWKEVHPILSSIAKKVVDEARLARLKEDSMNRSYYDGYGSWDDDYYWSDWNTFVAEQEAFYRPEKEDHHARRNRRNLFW